MFGQIAASYLVSNPEMINLAIYENYLIFSHDVKNQAQTSHAWMYLLTQPNYKLPLLKGILPQLTFIRY